ncbi:glutamate receptor ionotropic, delta-2-like [Epargyreus clarus]|uniref:glutamate receptor ionotropic, delta-2-like n=1 Tax=Epargyreus clarus TaxID=520877 RepID=UPI003C2D435B
MLALTTTLFPIEILVKIILNQYFSKSYCVTVVSDSPFEFEFSISFIKIVSNNTEELEKLMLDASENGCSDYIVKLTDPQKFMYAFDNVSHVGNIRRSDRRIIFLPSREINEKSTKMELESILTMKEASFVPNILLVVPAEIEGDCKGYDLVTHKYIGIENTDSPVRLDHWNSCTKTFERNANLFPNDMSNWDGKVLKVACFTYKPYVLLDLNTDIEPLGRDGMEMRIVDEFCRWVNCTVQLVRDDSHEWGEIYDNLTGVGVIGNVVEDRADIGITALYSWYEEFLVLDFSAPCIRTGITCIVPAPRLLASWELPLLPFTLSMWIALLFTFLYACVVLTIARGCSTDKVCLSTFGMMITQSRPEAEMSSWRIRRITGWLLITGLILDNAYGGGLTSTFTVPKYEQSIDTIQDIVDRKLDWGATHDAWIFSITLSQEPLIRSLLNQFKTHPAEELKRLSFTRSMAFSIEKLPAGNYAVGEYITKEAVLDFTVMLEDFYYEQCVVMLRKSSPYTAKISQFIGRLHESGLMLAWETQVALKHLDYKVQLEVKLSRSKRDVENIEALAFRHVLGIFILYGLGVTISILSFLIEMLANRR